MQQRSLSRTAFLGCRVLSTTTKCFSATIGWKCCNGGSAASAIELASSHRLFTCVPSHSHATWVNRAARRYGLLTRALRGRPCERRDTYSEDSRCGAGAEAFFHF